MRSLGRFDLPDAETNAMPAAAGPRADVIAADVALRRAVPKAVVREMKAGAPLVLVLSVPGPGWCQFVGDAVRRLLGLCTGVPFDAGRANFISSGCALYVRDGSERTLGRPDLSARYLPTHLAAGNAAIGVAADTSLLPREVLAYADHVIEVPPLRWVDLRRVVRDVTGEVLDGPPDAALAAACGPAEVAACVRPRSTPSRCLERLRHAVAAERVPNCAADVPALEDLAGYGEARDFGLTLKRDLARHRRDPAAVPTSALTRSILLAGPPGTGKTLYARALARSLDVPLVETGYGQWSTAGAGYLNDVMAAMERSFAAASAGAKTAGVAVLFVDELDSLPDRSALVGGRNDGWWTSLVNALLTMTEASWAGRAGVVLVGATNHVHRIDPALRRSGRFDRTVELRLPDAADLEAMVRTHLAGDLACEDVASVVGTAPPSTGADAARWVRDARTVARDAGRPLSLRDLAEQVMPPETRPAAELLAIARHEAAHAVVASALCRMRVRSVSLAAWGLIDGVTLFHPSEAARTRRDIEAEVVGILAGRAVEEAFGEATTACGGEAVSDLALATRYLAACHGSFGLGGSLSYRCDARDAAALARQDAKVRAVVEADLSRLYEKARAEVAARIAAIEAALVERRCLSGDELRLILAANPPVGAAPSVAKVLH